MDYVYIWGYLSVWFGLLTLIFKYLVITDRRERYLWKSQLLRYGIFVSGWWVYYWIWLSEYPQSSLVMSLVIGTLVVLFIITHLRCSGVSDSVVVDKKELWEKNKCWSHLEEWVAFVGGMAVVLGGMQV